MRILITESQFNRIMINEVRVKTDERSKIYEDDEWLVVVPLTHSASCKYGAGMPWCSATPSNSEGFDKRTLLIYILNKKDNTNKYAISYDDIIENNGKEPNFSWWDKHNLPFNGRNPFNLPYNIIEVIFEYIYSKHIQLIPDKIKKAVLIHNNSQPVVDGVRINQYDQNKIKQGYWEDYYNNGQLVSKGRYVDGKKDGYWEFYYRDGKLWYKVNYVNGEMDGYFEFYYDNGKLKEKGYYKNNKKNGYWEKYNYSGVLDSKGNYKDDKKEGYWEYYNGKGEFESKYKFKDGKVVNFN